MLRFDDDAPALVDATGGVTWSHGDLVRAVSEHAAELGDDRSLVFLFADVSRDSVTWLLSCLRAGHPVALLDPRLGSAEARALVDVYRPEILVGAVPESLLSSGSYRPQRPGLNRRVSPEAGWLNPDLAVLLPTSGSTGNPKLVRLSRSNIESNAAAIAASLVLTRGDRVPTMLPIHYSYGMSLVTSHLLSGGSLLISDSSVMERRFWDVCRAGSVTFLAGVPYTYQMLSRLRFDPEAVPTLRAMTQAGGRLPVAAAERFHADMTRVGGEFFVMYGQTEAAPRISCLPSSDFPRKRGSAGLPLEGGRLSVIDSPGAPAGSGQVIYEGPNVMLGYATCRDDLAQGNDTGGRLETGDLGYLDQEGYLFLTGRTRRIGKVFGVRINLDDIEAHLRQHGPVAVAQGPDETLRIVCEWPTPATVAEARLHLSTVLRVPPKSLAFDVVDALPLLSSGKIDYQSISGGASQ